MSTKVIERLLNHKLARIHDRAPVTRLRGLGQTLAHVTGKGLNRAAAALPDWLSKPVAEALGPVLQGTSGALAKANADIDAVPSRADLAEVTPEQDAALTQVADEVLCAQAASQATALSQSQEVQAACGQKPQDLSAPVEQYATLGTLRDGALLVQGRVAQTKAVVIAAEGEVHNHMQTWKTAQMAKLSPQDAAALAAEFDEVDQIGALQKTTQKTRTDNQKRQVGKLGTQVTATHGQTVLDQTMLDVSQGKEVDDQTIETAYDALTANEAATGATAGPADPAGAGATHKGTTHPAATGQAAGHRPAAKANVSKSARARSRTLH